MMATQTKSVVELARKAGFVLRRDEHVFNEMLKAFADAAIEQYKQDLLKGVELPEERGFVDVDGDWQSRGYSNDQLHQAIAAAVLPLKAEIERLNIALIGASEGASDRKRAEEMYRQAELLLTEPEKTLQSRVTQLEQELAAALAYKQDAERGRFMIANGSWWIRAEERTHLAVLVPQGSDLSCYAMREKAIDAARTQEVKTPEASKGEAV